MRGTVRDWAIWSTLVCAFVGLKLVGVVADAMPSFPSNRELSSADGSSRPGRYDDDSVLLGTTDDDASSTKSSDLTNSADSSMRGSSSGGTRSSSSSTSGASTASSSSSSTNPSSATKAPRTHNGKSSSSTTSSNDLTSSTTDLGNSTAGGKDEVDEASYSEWTFHNETAAADNAKHSLSVTNTTQFLPPENEQTDSWTFAVLAIFTVLAVVLLSVTTHKTCRDRARRNSYEEITSIVV